ncbi:MAG: phosphate transporter, inner rane subunit PstC [Bacteroidetes bacterium]|jgi:phosphate ABC transporter permease protein PstC|nr:phosphate transporter, inner rane subunit PstC [Bacteroidota bacterium]
MSIIGEKGVRRILLVTAFSALSALLLIALFIINEGVPFIFRYGLRDFLFSSEWKPAEGRFGIFPMLAASVWVTLGAMAVGAPLGIAGAVFLSEFAPKSVMRIIKPAIELLAAIPSVVYGFIGVMVLAPLIRSSLGGPGLSILAGSIILGIMILPTIMSISIDSLLAVPQSFREGSLALGATTWQGVYLVIVRAAKSGIIAGVILGMGRAIGETMAVIMVAGNAVKIPDSALDSARTLTANIALEMSYATGMHRQALFATGVVLFVVIIILNSLATVVIKGKVARR